MERKCEPEIISASTILILSLFLLGVSFADPVSEFSFYAFSCSLTGLLGYAAFELAGEQGGREMMRRSQLLLENRLLRHISIAESAHSAQLANQSEKKRLLEWLHRETESLN